MMASRFDEDRPCTIEELTNIVTADTGGFTMLPNDSYNEVYPNIFIGEESIALNVLTLERLKVTHVLNAALGKDRYHVNTNHVMYRKVNIKFLGLEATDFQNFDLTQYFDKSIEFISEALENSGKILVHCVQGVSRSATLVLAYLMNKHHMTVQDAMRLVRKRREICPNDGFLQQLCNYNEKLKKAGHFEEQKQDQT